MRKVEDYIFFHLSLDASSAEEKTRRHKKQMHWCGETREDKGRVGPGIVVNKK